MATKKRSTVVGTVDNTVDNTAANTMNTMKTPVEVISIPLPLEDVQLQAGMFKDREPGRYILQYQQGSAVLPVAVYWTGTLVIA